MSEERTETTPKLPDPHLATVNIGGFHLGMTLHAAERVIKEKGYLEDTAHKPTYAERNVTRTTTTFLWLTGIPPNRANNPHAPLQPEHAHFSLQFENGILTAIEYAHENISAAALRSAMADLDAQFAFIRDRTNRGGREIWRYDPSPSSAQLEFVSNADERQDLPQCSYKVTLWDYSLGHPYGNYV
jgi:hypothetical protein